MNQECSQKLYQKQYENASVNDNITHIIVETSNVSESNITMITNNNNEGEEIVSSKNIIDKEIVKDAKIITIKQNTLRTSIIVDKSPNVVESRAKEKESTISCLEDDITALH